MRSEGTSIGILGIFVHMRLITAITASAKVKLIFHVKFNKFCKKIDENLIFSSEIPLTSMFSANNFYAAWRKRKTSSAHYWNL